MPRREGREPGARAEEQLLRAHRAADRLVAGLTSLGLLDAPSAMAARLMVRERSRHLFVFVLLSVLLEGRPGQDPEDREVAEALKAAFAGQLVETRRQAEEVLSKGRRLKPGHGDALKARIALGDPFAPYYGSFEKARKDPELGPFGILAERLSRDHFEEPHRRTARERIFTLAAALSDELVEGL